MDKKRLVTRLCPDPLAEFKGLLAAGKDTEGKGQKREWELMGGIISPIPSNPGSTIA